MRTTPSAPFLERPLHSFPWLPTPRVRALERFGLATAGDLLRHYPRRHENRKQFPAFPQGETAEPVCICGVVSKTALKRFGPRRMFEVTLQEPGGHALGGVVVLRWFNLHFVQKMIAQGQRLIAHGRPKRKGRQVVMDHPEFEVVEEDEAGASVHLNRITPVHPATEGITPRQLRVWIHRLLEELDQAPPPESPLPPSLGGMEYAVALRAIHFPDSLEAYAAARRELVLAEFFEMQLILAARHRSHAGQAGLPHCGPGRLLESFLATLPFALTGAQRRAIAEIRADLAAPRMMNRMLHGDVGAGKTLVALAAMLLAVEAGYQAALMAPTQILAEQHYLNFKRWLAPLGVRLALRTGSRQEESALPLFDDRAWSEAVRNGDAARPAAALPPGEPQILIGTHALLYDKNPPPRLGLAVIDEQHKFGVLQRAALTRGAEAPDVLVMTATPIPRTLTMTLYGDLDVSMLDELPANRGKIITAARPPEKLPEAVAFIRKHLAAGRQAYVVYPLVEASERLEAKAATAEYEKWKEVFAPYRCELLHGRTPPEQKEAIMARFRANESRVLVATTVIEVGVDVPNANLMLIENAERFGLAQLHQLRGRIGRGEHKSYCILLHSADTPEAQEKMNIVEATSNGFEIAEADLRLRGAGDLLGTAQSGLPPLRLGDLFHDADLMRAARQAARELLEADPGLTHPAHRRFRPLLAAQREQPTASALS